MIARARRGWRRWLLWGAGVLAVPLAVALALVAADVLRTPGQVSRDDSRFQTAPMRQAGLWEVGFLPGDVGRRLLDLDDDVEYRRLVGEYLRIEPGKVDFAGFPELEALRAKVQFELTRLSRADPDPKRRSRLLTLYGVMTLDIRSLVSSDERSAIVRNAVSAFRNAIEFDPDNEDAKRNLETALRIFPASGLTGAGPSGGRSEGRISGQGITGSGY